MQNIQEVLHLLLEELLAEGDVDPEGGRDGVGRTPCDRQPVNLIDDSRLRSLTARQLVAALQRDGFIPARQRGSHHRYEHPDGRKVTVPFPSPGDPFLPLSINPPAGR